MYQIVDTEQDVAGKWRVRVDIAGRTVMFKYDEMPDDEVIQAEAARYEAAQIEAAAEEARQKELEEQIAAQIALMQEQVDGAPDPG